MSSAHERHVSPCRSRTRPINVPWPGRAYIDPGARGNQPVVSGGVWHMVQSQIDFPSHSLGSAIERLSHRWFWFVAFGVLIALLGALAIALVVSATIASVFLIGIFIVFAGAVEIFVGFGSRTWSRFFLWVAAGLLYLVAGAIAIAQPFFAAVIFTLLLGAGLLATGVVRLWLAWHLPAGQPKGLVVFSGAVTACLGLVITLGWPGDSLFILGMLLGIDLIFYGAGWIGFGFLLRGHVHPDHRHPA